MDKISVIVPVYNCEKYIAICIDSILQQTYTNFELIIIDDGSTDSSLIIANSYNDDRIKVYSKENGGVSSARNIGLENVTGEFIVFVDADDELVSPTFFDELMRYSYCDYIVSGFMHRYLKNGIVQSNKKSSLLEEEGSLVCELPDDFFIKGFIHPCWGKLYRTQIIKENNIKFQMVRLSEDSLFNIEYLNYIHRWKIVDTAGYCYMHRNTGTNATAKFYDSDIDIYIRLFNELKLISIKKNVIKRTIYAQFLSVCLRCISCGYLTIIEKKRILSGILHKQYVRKILLTTKTSFGEWLTGAIVCTGNIQAILLWKRFINKLK